MEFPTRYTFLGLELNAAVDRGCSLDPDQLGDHIRDGTLFELLDADVPGLDLSPYDKADERASMGELFHRIHNASSGYGVQNNGLSLLVAYCIEAVQAGEAG